MDWNKLQHTLFALDPSDPAEDLRKLKESAGATSDVAPQNQVDPMVLVGGAVVIGG